MATLEDEIVELKRGIAEYEEDLRQAKKNRNDQMILSTQALITATLPYTAYNKETAHRSELK